MRTIKFLLQKEFRQIFRNRSIVAIILFLPVAQLVILPLAANYEVKKIYLSLVDHDHSTCSKELIKEITASGYFKLVSDNSSFKEAFAFIESEKADLILEIPSGFERNLIRENEQKLFIAVNAINGVKANLGGAYLNTMIRKYNTELRASLINDPKTNVSPAIEITYSNWYNPYMNYRLFMVPGILAFLLTMIGVYLTALNIVKEKETGTIEQINVTPIKKHHFILGKLIPFWILGLLVFTLGLIVSWLVYDIVPVGSLVLLYIFVAVYLLAVLGLGLLISAFCETQQQAMFLSFFFMMIFIMMGGLFTSIDSMPEWAKIITLFNPVSYMIEIMRLLVLKGSGFKEIRHHLLIIAGFAVLFISWAVFKYRKTS